MLEYHTAYYKQDSGWYVAEVLDFPGVLSQGKTLKSARRMIRDALRLMADCDVDQAKPLPLPNARARARKADFFEPVRLSIKVHMGARQ